MGNFTLLDTNQRLRDVIPVRFFGKMIETPPHGIYGINIPYIFGYTSKTERNFLCFCNRLHPGKNQYRWYRAGGLILPGPKNFLPNNRSMLQFCLQILA
jgi:hypothetical protein